MFLPLIATWAIFSYMYVLVIGFGPHGSGAEAAEYYNNAGHKVTIYETRKKSQVQSLIDKLDGKGIDISFDEHVLQEIEKYDIVVKAPSVPLKYSVIKKAHAITNDLAALLESPLTKNISFIVVVGSKGKTTSAAILTHALNALGYRATSCGGIGKSGFHILSELASGGDRSYTHIVIAMANWQIGDTHMFLDRNWPRLSAILITTQTKKEEIKEEFGILLRQDVGKIIADRSLKKEIVRQKGDRKKFAAIPSHFNPYVYPSPEASCYETLRALRIPRRKIIKALKSYKGVPDRLEQIAIKNGILYINDSASTIPESVVFAVRTMGEVSIHLICGGTDKRGELDENTMKQAFRYVSSITLLSGSFTKKLIPMLDKSKRRYHGPYDSMKDALSAARSEAESFYKEKGSTQIVLLSPGSSSLEHFENEFNRGDTFRHLVEEI